MKFANPIRSDLNTGVHTDTSVRPKFAVVTLAVSHPEDPFIDLNATSILGVTILSAAVEIFI